MTSPIRVEPIWDRVPAEKVIVSGLSYEHIRLVLDALGEELDKIDTYRLIQAEQRVRELEAQLAAVPVSTADAFDARCWRYLREEHPRQIAAALNCGDYYIDETMRDVLPGPK